MVLKVKKLNDRAFIPLSAHVGDAGFDLIATDIKVEQQYVEYSTGLALEIPLGYVGLIFPRSSNSAVDQILANCVGVIDSGYRGEITVRFRNAFPLRIYVDKNEPLPVIYSVGDKIAQLVIFELPSIQVQEVNELAESDRGNGGYGSTGR